MLRGCFILVALCGCGRIAFEPLEPLRDWSEHIEISIQNAGRAETFTDFPLLVALDANRIDYSLAADDGRDLRFADANGKVLEHEIESWNPSDRSIVWVRVPTIAAATDATTITMAYGNPEALAISGSRTWSDEYLGVYHCVDEVLADATAARRGGMSVNAAFARGPLGIGLELSQAGAPSYAMIPYHPTFDNVVTISGWLRQDAALEPFTSLIVQPIPDVSPDATYLGVRNAVLYAEVVDLDNAFVTSASSNPVVPQRWTHLALALDGAVASFYVDGVLLDSLALVAGANRPASAYFVGSDCDACPAGSTVANSDFLEGGIDELRLERVVRSGLWIEAQVASMRDELLVFRN